jgi:hypothetical protein
MSYPINYPTPQGADIQIFSQGGSTSDWTKPQGASFVWFTLIGGGGGGSAADSRGGGAAVVTNFMCPAFLIPDVLNVTVGMGGATNSDGGVSIVGYRLKATTEYSLLSANGGMNGSSITSNVAMTANYFTAMGFFQSVAGGIGSQGTVTASATTFLGPGTAGAVSYASNYGYTKPSGNSPGLFQLQPIIVGMGGQGSGVGGVGCGGGINNRGGPGLVVIITW